MKIPEVTCVDFESEAIRPRPHYPPVPVGVSIMRPGERKSKYYAFSHPVQNYCTKAEAGAVLRDCWRAAYREQGAALLFQNANFDLDVAEVHFGLKPPPWYKIHDTLYLIFLQQPHADSYSLKPAAERFLGLKPEERDAVRDWLMVNCQEARRKPSEWGGYICRAPGLLVGKYADSDVLRTEKLFKFLLPKIAEAGMLPAYDRERKLAPYLLANEREGICVDLPRLEQDFVTYSQALAVCDAWIRRRLCVANDFNIDSDMQLAEALERNGLVSEWTLTPKGKKSVSKKNLLPTHFTDLRVANAFGYRNKLSTCLGTFMEPWLRVARETGGRVHTHWNSVRQSHGDHQNVGAHTGRMSSSPNFQNLPKSWKKAMSEGYRHPEHLKALPLLPLMRQYFLPDKGEVWGRRDYSQQELRILAFYEDGQLMRDYVADPRLDIHQKVQDGILEIGGIELPREKTKIVNFSDIYGKGLGGLAAELQVDMATALRIRNAKNQLMPGVAQLIEDIKARGKAGLPIRTWGDILIYARAAMYSKKFDRVMDFVYQLTNHLIQSSCSSILKESIIRYHEHPRKRGRWLVGVHDENDLSAPKMLIKPEMQVMRESMQSIEVAPMVMLSDGETGPNWGALTAFKERECLTAYLYTWGAGAMGESSILKEELKRARAVKGEK